jgi:hypothetical protein
MTEVTWFGFFYRGIQGCYFSCRVVRLPSMPDHKPESISGYIA